MRYTYKTIPPEWKDVNSWRAADATLLDDASKVRFEKMQKAICLYLRTGHLAAAVLEAGVSRSVLIDQVNRCLLPTRDGGRVGWFGLIKGARLKAYVRKIEIPNGLSVDGECFMGGGAFSKLLDDHPAIKRDIDNAIAKGEGKGAVRAGKSTSKGIFGIFVRACKKELTLEQYPLNTKSKGRRSLERYIRQFVDFNHEAMAVWYGDTAADHLRVGNGKSSFSFSSRPFDVAGVDAHKMHAIGIVVVPGPAGRQRIPVERIWLYTYGDFASRAVLGYSLTIRREPSSATLEEAFVRANKPWKPRDLRIQGLHYKDGAGLPLGTIEGLESCASAAIVMDNAAQHFAKRIVDRVRKRFGCALRWGAVGAWWRNAITERLYQTLESHGFQRLPSSTGSNPVDPLRHQPVNTAIKHEIEWEELVDLADVIIANYNATAQSVLGKRSPLDVLRAHLDSGHPEILPKIPLPPTVLTPVLGVSIECRTVRGVRKVGKIKRPYIQIDEVEYTNAALSDRFDWIGQELTLHINEAEFHEVIAYTASGELIGTLTPTPRGWRTPHTRDIRKQINRLIICGELSDITDDPVAAYMAHLAKKAREQALKNPKKISTAASQLAEACRTTGRPIPNLTEATGKINSPRLPFRPTAGFVKPPSWKSK